MILFYSNYSQIVPLKMYVGKVNAQVSSPLEQQWAACKRHAVPASTHPFGPICVVICCQQKMATYGVPCTGLLHCGAEALRKRTRGASRQLCVVWGEDTQAGAEQLLVTPGEDPHHGLPRRCAGWRGDPHPESGLYHMDLLWRLGGVAAGERRPTGNQALMYLHNFWTLSPTANPF